MNPIIEKLLASFFSKRGYLLLSRKNINTENIYLTARLKKIISTYKIDCIIDVGANEGQYGQFLRRSVGYKGLIVSFEPDPDAYQKLKFKIDKDPLWITHNVALGEEEEELTFNLMERSVFNSFLFPNPNELKRFKFNIVKAKISILVRRLDAFIPQIKKSHGIHRIFLKIDTQGYDLKVFLGCSGCLDSIVGIQTEVSVLPIYNNMPGASESLQLFRKMGYEVSGIYSLGEERFPHAAEFDFIYLPRVWPNPR